MAIELDELLSSYVTPLLRAKGYRKNHHLYRAVNASGDQVAVSFRGASGDRGCFYLEWFALLVPAWEMHQYARGRSDLYPAGKLERETGQRNGVVEGRSRDPDNPPNIDWGWKWRSHEQMHQAGQRVQKELTENLLPALDVYLDRARLLRLPLERPAKQDIFANVTADTVWLAPLARLALTADEGNDAIFADTLDVIHDLSLSGSPWVRFFAGDIDRACEWACQRRASTRDQS